MMAGKTIPSGEIDLLVAGQGLAGTALALAAREAGLRVHVADPSPVPGATASWVAAGLITPLTGRKINPGWRLDTFLPTAEAFYTRHARLLGVDAYRCVPLVRWFADEDERESIERRRGDDRVGRWVDGLVENPPPGLRAPWGGFRMRGSGWLDTRAWLEAARTCLASEGAFTAAAVSEEDLEFDGDGVCWRAMRARHVVLCQGIAAARSRHFTGMPFRPACGEVLELAWEQRAGEPELWNRAGKWLAPRGGGCALFGATYGFGEWEARARPEGIAELKTLLAGLLESAPEVTGVRCGVRPILHQSRPVAGFHPQRPRLGFFNGLGSKGVLTSPWVAEQLVRHLVDGEPLDGELDLATFPRWQPR